ncbi:hypothetical protein H6F86_16180 [Phormidium sp. FACHB-592]|uniref:Queuine tRNA-ribosyltransferase family protein n=1 Tax=Stenomitos frigidus AS-A4 TaxID=2933935 RepID=A0ABV0KQ23_9CYAN|nr:hypothetical protein [Phormidium sp. FACHB-592]MBD2075405.1 hypothetical protein [Phormidium sp. FACHB-592]
MPRPTEPTTPTELVTRKGTVPLPLYLPTLSLGRFVLDKHVLPYLLPDLAPGVMVSQRYVAYLEAPFAQSLWLDSGAYALLSVEQATWSTGLQGLGQISLPPSQCKHAGCDQLHPKQVLDAQEALAEVGFTLDIPIPPECSAQEASQRLAVTLKNAAWALRHKQRKDLKLFASLPFYNLQQAQQTAKTYAQMYLNGKQFDGIAVGGLVPHLADEALLLAIVKTVRENAPGLPIHLFGVGEPALCHQLFAAGATSTDSPTFLTRAARGQRWGSEAAMSEPSLYEKVHLALMNLAEGQQSTLPFSPFLLSLATWYMRPEVKRKSKS